MKDKQQTAVQWLIEQIECRGLVTKELREEFKQALQMENSQKAHAFNFGMETQRLITNKNNE
jgi:intergrase/recombinase